MDSYDTLKLQDALFRAKLREALGLSSPEGADLNTYKLMLKKKRISSLLKEQLKAAGFEDLARQTRIRRG